MWDLIVLVTDHHCLSFYFGAQAGSLANMFTGSDLDLISQEPPSINYVCGRERKCFFCTLTRYYLVANSS